MSKAMRIKIKFPNTVPDRDFLCLNTMNYEISVSLRGGMPRYLENSFCRFQSVSFYLNINHQVLINFSSTFPNIVRVSSLVFLYRSSLLF